MRGTVECACILRCGGRGQHFITGRYYPNIRYQVEQAVTWFRSYDGQRLQQMHGSLRSLRKRQAVDIHVNLLGFDPSLYYRHLTGMVMVGLFVMANVGNRLTTRLDVMVLGVDQQGNFLPMGCFGRDDAEFLVSAKVGMLIVAKEDVEKVKKVFMEHGMAMEVVGAKTMDDALGHIIVAADGRQFGQTYYKGWDYYVGRRR